MSRTLTVARGNTGGTSWDVVISDEETDFFPSVNYYHTPEQERHALGDALDHFRVVQGTHSRLNLWDRVEEPSCRNT